jgi:hypothetical protein
MRPQEDKAVTGILVNLLFWFFFLAIIALSLLISYRFDSVLLGFGVFVALAALMGFISLKVRGGRPVHGSSVISPKTSNGPDTCLKDFPLLYLYFDDFPEMESAWRNGLLEAARDDRDERSRDYAIGQIMSDASLFLELYRENLVRVLLNDGTELRRDTEMEYWRRASGHGHERDASGKKPEGAKEGIAGVGLMEILAQLEKEMEPTVEAIRQRYGIQGRGTAAPGQNAGDRV